MSDIMPLEADFGAPRVLVPAPADPRFAHLGWPKIVRAADGTLVIGLLAGREHVWTGGECCPAVSVSRDGGQSFSAPQILVELGIGRPFQHSGNIAMGVTRSGALVLLAMAMTSDATRTSMFGWRSADSARTWQPVDVSTLAGRVGSVYGRVVALDDGRLMVFGMLRRGATFGEKGIWMAVSGDDGWSWQEPRVLARESLGEPALCLAGNRLVGLVREGGAMCYRLITSDDAGATWAFSPSGVGSGPDLPSPFITTLPGDSTRLYALQTDRRRDDNEAQGAIYLWTADVADLRWRRMATVARFSKRASPERPDYGYPWMTPVDNGEWLLAFYCGRVRGANSIWGMRLALA